MTRTLVDAPAGRTRTHPAAPTRPAPDGVPWDDALDTVVRASPGSTRVVAVAAVGLLTFNYPLVDAFTTAIVVPLVLVPVWWSATRRFVGARALLALAAVAVVSGVWLAAWASTTHEVNPSTFRAALLLLVGGFAGIGMLLWARTVLPLRTVALAAAGGIVARLALVPPNPVNPWKHGISYAVVVLVLALLVRRRPGVLEVGVLLVLAVVSALNDSRSAFATLLLTALLVAWQLRPTTWGRRGSAIATICLFAGVAACVYQAGQALILEGALGQATAERSRAQIEASGSLILGGRPEWGASTALVAHRPTGFGLGVVANLQDILVAKAGMARLQYDPNNGYVENYMFGREIKLHALVADLWSQLGIPGALLAAVLLVVTVWSLASLVARRRAPGLTIYLTCLLLWNFAFGPVLSSMPSLVLGLGLLLMPRAAPGSAPAAEPPTLTSALPAVTRRTPDAARPAPDPARPAPAPPPTLTAAIPTVTRRPREDRATLTAAIPTVNRRVDDGRTLTAAVPRRDDPPEDEQ